MPTHIALFCLPRRNTAHDAAPSIIVRFERKIAKTIYTIQSVACASNGNIHEREDLLTGKYCAGRQSMTGEYC